MGIPVLVLMLNAAVGAGVDLPSSLSPRALVPSRMHIAVNEAAELRIDSTGAAKERAARWPEGEIVWLFHRSDGKQTNRDTLAPSVPGGESAALTLADPGVSMIGLQFKPQVVALDAKQLDELRGRFDQAANDERAAPRAPAKGTRVRVQSTATALIQVTSAESGSDEPSAIATSKSGLKTEIRAMFDPTRCKAGDDLPVRVYADGDRAAGAVVRAIGPDGKAVASATNPAGFATIAITSPGTWRIEVQHLVPARDDPDAEWVLYVGLLTFATTDLSPTGQGGGR